MITDERGGGEMAPPHRDAPTAPAPRRRRRHAWPTIALFLTPALLIFGLLVLTPLGEAAYASFFNGNGFGVPTDFVGLGNFRRLLVDDIFVGDLRRTLLLITL